MWIKRDDLVKVTKPKFPPKERFKGGQGKVLRVLAEDGKVIVEGMNLVWEHVARSQKHPKGGRIQREAPMRIDNVMLVCQSCGKPTRPKVGWIEDSEVAKKSRRKVRFCRKCNKPVKPEEK
ncbi:MAG TPA: 50S ribosomal protein L24 [Planctomycetota bacterium]|nr:50S ribosomal protein L24 [Planctomycetota bacterium]